MYLVPLVQAGSAVLLNACFAWLIGSMLARRWLAIAGATVDTVEGTIRQYDLVAVTSVDIPGSPVRQVPRFPRVSIERSPMAAWDEVQKR